MSVTARVPDSTPYWVNLFLDRGVQGITGPHINDAEEAQNLSDACLFPPHGKRSWGGGRGTEFDDIFLLKKKYGGKLDFAKWTNSNMLVWAQIESKIAWENLDSILDVEGLTGITGGPNDLAASLGHPGEPDHKERIRITDDTENRTRKAGKLVASDTFSAVDIHGLMLTYSRELATKIKKEKI